MAKGSTTRSGNLKIVLMMVLVVVLSWAAVDRLSKKKAEKEEASREVPVPTEVEAKPVIKRGSIVEASWRESGRAMPEPEEDANAEKGDQWDLFGDKAREKERRDRELKEAVDDVNGLGVYVASGSDDTEEDE